MEKYKFSQKSLYLMIATLMVCIGFVFLFPAWALEPPRPGEIEKLKAEGKFEERLKNVLEIGNHKVDPYLVEKFKTKLKRKILESKGMATSELDVLSAQLPPGTNPGLQSTGSPKIFALLIDFPDHPHVVSETDINNMLFGNGNPAHYPYESLRNYYDRSSYGLLDLRYGTTLGWYQTSYNRSDVVQTEQGRENLIKEVLNHFVPTHDFSQYDNDGDGDIDFFIIMWTGPSTGWGSFWWSYQTFWTDNSYVIDGKTMSSYNWIEEQWLPKTTIHEVGHGMGLPDLYDYKEDVGPRNGVGGFDMMGGDGDHNCFSKWMLDWVDPIVFPGIKQDMTLEIGVLKDGTPSSKDCVLIWPGIGIDDIFSEFYLVENRQCVGNDESILKFPSWGFAPDGLAIWHIDATLDIWGQQFKYNNSDTDHKLVRLMEADGLEEIETAYCDKSTGTCNTDPLLNCYEPAKDLYWDGTCNPSDADDLYADGNRFGPNTIPSSDRYDGTDTCIRVCDINKVSIDDYPMKATFGISCSTQPPHGDIYINDDAQYTNSTAVKLTLNCYDSEGCCIGMRIGSTEQDLGSAIWESYRTSYDGWTLIPGDGYKMVYAQYMDDDGLMNWSIQDSIILDTTAPTGTISINNSAAATNSSTVTLNLSCTDNLSGCSQVRFGRSLSTILNAPWEPFDPIAPTKTYTLFSGDGNKTVYVQYKDTAGNTSTYHASILLDTTAPTGWIVINSPRAKYTNTPSVTLNLSCTDSLSGCSQMRFGRDPWALQMNTQWEPYARTKTYTLFSGDGNKFVYVQYKDAAGNISKIYSDSILLDTTAPAGTVSINGGAAEATSSVVTLNLSCTDNLSGCAQMAIYNPSALIYAWMPYAETRQWSLFPGDGNKTVYVKYKDAVGNISEVVSDSILVTVGNVTILSPNGGEIIPAGSVYSIQWEAPPEAGTFDLLYSINKGASWISIVNGVTGNSFSWLVPATAGNKNDCLVKVIGYDALGGKVGEDTSDAPFTIEVVKVTSPNGGETWNVGSTRAITWKTNGTKNPVAGVKLSYTTGGGIWNLIGNVVSNPGTYNWKVPAAASANCRVKVVLMDSLGRTMGTDVSDRLFTIKPTIKP